MIPHDYTQAQICCLQELKSYDANSEARSLTHKGDLYTGAILRQQCSGIARTVSYWRNEKGCCDTTEYYVLLQVILICVCFDLTPEIVC